METAAIAAIGLLIKRYVFLEPDMEPGRLTEEEFAVMKTHSMAGKELPACKIHSRRESMFMDWNGNGRIDPVDIGVSIAASGAEGVDAIQIGGHSFQFVQELAPEKNLFGKIKTYDPTEHDPKRKGKPRNKYGQGPFCRFSLKSSAYDRVCGVYALLDDDGLLYIGQTVDLQQRYNVGYGNIEAVNCYVGGQSTNCKINSMVLQKYREGKHVYLFFCATADYDRIERELIDALEPPYNSKHAARYAKPAGAPRRAAPSAKGKAPESDRRFPVIWQRILLNAGETFTTLRQIPFQYRVAGDTLYPLHIQGAVSKASFEQAYGLGAIQSVAQLRRYGVAMPSYVYAILTDPRITEPRPPAGEDQKETDPFAIPKQRTAPPPAPPRTPQPISQSAFSVGDRVEHRTFGAGTVEMVHPLGPDVLLAVRFDTMGKKHLMESGAPLKKVEYR